MAEIIRVLVPFSRPRLFETLKGIWGKTEDVIFHPIIHDGINPIESSDQIQPFYCGEIAKGWNEMYWKLNYFLDQMPIHEKDRYSILCDDDAFEPGFHQKIQNHPDDVVICSMKRGKRQPPAGNGHPPTTLLAQKENMKIGSVGAEQMFIRGKLLKPLRFGNFPEADGEFISNVVNNHPVKYLPNAFVWFNYFETGRW